MKSSSVEVTFDVNSGYTRKLLEKAAGVGSDGLSEGEPVGNVCAEVEP